MCNRCLSPYRTEHIKVLGNYTIGTWRRTGRRSTPLYWGYFWYPNIAHLLLEFLIIVYRHLYAVPQHHTPTDDDQRVLQIVPIRHTQIGQIPMPIAAIIERQQDLGRRPTASGITLGQSDQRTHRIALIRLGHCQLVV